MLKYHLRYKGLTAGMKDTREAVIDRYIRYVEDGDITIDDMYRDLLDLQEYASKVVYLYHAPLRTVQRVGVGPLPNQVAERSEGRIALMPDRPTVNYSYANADVIRVSFSERHTDVDVDIYDEEFRTNPVNKVVVLNANRHNGLISLGYDKPERLHPHGRGNVEYYDWYKERAWELLGFVAAPYDLTHVLDKLEESTLVRIPYGRGKTLDGRVDLKSDRDYRRMRVYRGVRTEVVVRDRGRYVWLPTKDIRTYHRRGPLPRDNPLEREVWTEIYGNPGIVWFSRDAAKAEVEHVLERIRDIAEAAP